MRQDSQKHGCLQVTRGKLLHAVKPWHVRVAYCEGLWMSKNGMGVASQCEIANFELQETCLIAIELETESEPVTRW